MSTKAISEMEHDRMGRASYQAAVESIKMNFAGLPGKPEERKNKVTRQKTEVKPENTEEVDWHLINNLPHNQGVDEVEETDPEASTPKWHVIESLDHNIGVDQSI